MSAVGNLISWFIGVIIMYLWTAIGMILGLIGGWQTGLDGVHSTMESFAFDDMSSKYTRGLTYEV